MTVLGVQTPGDREALLQRISEGICFEQLHGVPDFLELFGELVLGNFTGLKRSTKNQFSREGT